ncbi:Uncharacterized protein dnm_023390 [Desulfonema magnum]|uniref:Uncharacterized protein n=1 Tax=Desulfonema magnum TaxID=45655 RepID=A0A975BIU0_9BACT|nr:Uncharacterized protein dnm_023390 [Desulfonema magnum]
MAKLAANARISTRSEVIRSAKIERSGFLHLFRSHPECKN